MESTAEVVRELCELYIELANCWAEAVDLMGLVGLGGNGKGHAANCNNGKEGCDEGRGGNGFQF